jgi:hypothetical protein
MIYEDDVYLAIDNARRNCVDFNIIYTSNFKCDFQDNIEDCTFSGVDLSNINNSLNDFCFCGFNRKFYQNYILSFAAEKLIGNIFEIQHHFCMSYKEDILYRDVIKESEKYNSGIFFLGIKQTKIFRSKYELASGLFKSINGNLVLFIPHEEDLFAFVPESKL